MIYKIDEETARADLERLADMMDIDLTLDPDMDAKEQKDSQKSIDTVVKAIRKGDLVITDEGEAVFTPARSKGVDPITFREPTGATLLAADKYSDNQKMHKMYAMVAEMTGTPNATFGKLKKSDMNVVMAVGIIFLG